MKKADKIKLLYFLSISLIFSLVGCVDTGVQNIPDKFDFQSSFKIVNLASASNVQSVTMQNADGSEVGNFPLAIGEEYPAEGQGFQTIPSGSKTFLLNLASGPDETIRVTLDSERKTRLYIYNSDSSTIEIRRSNLRYTWQEKNSGHGSHLFFPDSAYVSFFNTAIDYTVASILVITGSDTLEVETDVAAGEATSLMLAAPANYTLSFVSGNDVTLSTLALNANAMSRYSTVLYTNTSGAIQSKVYLDD